MASWKLLYVQVSFCEVAELHSNSSIQFQALFDCAEGPMSTQCRATRTICSIWQAWLATDFFKTNVTYLRYVSGIFAKYFTQRGVIYFSFLAGTLQIVLEKWVSGPKAVTAFGPDTHPSCLHLTSNQHQHENQTAYVVTNLIVVSSWWWA